MIQPTTTVRAETVERAVQLALKKLNLTEDEVEINVINEGRKGIFGFGRRDAIVEVSAKLEDVSLKELTKQLEASLDEEKEISSVEEVEVKEEVEEAEPIIEEKVEEVEIKEPSVKEFTTKEEVKETEVENKEEAPKEQTQQFEEGDRDVAIQKAVDYIESVLKVYGTEVEVNVKDQGRQIYYEIETEKPGLVIGRHGRILNALQSLVQIIINSNNIRRTQVVLNVGDYRQRRSKTLKQMAERTARQARRTKQPQVIEFLPAYERKQIHNHLSRVNDIKTYSEGKDPNRYLVVEYIG